MTLFFLNINNPVAFMQKKLIANILLSNYKVLIYQMYQSYMVMMSHSHRLTGTFSVHL